MGHNDVKQRKSILVPMKQEKAKKTFHQAQKNLSAASKALERWQDKWSKALSGPGLKEDITISEAIDLIDTWICQLTGQFWNCRCSSTRHRRTKFYLINSLRNLTRLKKKFIYTAQKRLQSAHKQMDELLRTAKCDKAEELAPVMEKFALSNNL